MTDLAFASAAELALMIRNREISPVEVMGATLARIERSQPMLNAFITIAAEPAMADARAAEAAVMRGAPLGPLHGVPLAVKDLVPTAGIRTTWGSLIFKDHIPETDAEVVARLKRAGAIVVGKTTTPEFGQQCLTEAPLFGRTRNAWRADRSSGGSSGGRRSLSPQALYRSRSQRTAAARRVSLPPATALSASSRGLGWCRRNTRRTGSALFPTSRQ